MRVLDLAAHMRDAFADGEVDQRYRPDGTHMSGEGAPRLAHDWLEGEILRRYREWGAGGRAGAVATPPTVAVPPVPALTAAPS